MRRLRAAWLLAIVLAALAGASSSWLRAAVSPVQRGYELADAHGCFACHGPGGLIGFEDPADKVGVVPAFTREVVESYARDESEIREWIQEGMPRRLRAESAPDARPALLVMPAFKQVLSASDVDDLVAYVVAASDYHAPEDGPLAAGRDVAARFGCFTCHGPQGRGSPRNPGSFKGRIPAWDSADFADLVRDGHELREWILDGSPVRLRDNRLARFFIGRQKIQMPAFRGRLEEAELNALAGYVDALRAGSARHARPAERTSPASLRN